VDNNDYNDNSDYSARFKPDGSFGPEMLLHLLQNKLGSALAGGVAKEEIKKQLGLINDVVRAAESVQETWTGFSVLVEGGILGTRGHSIVKDCEDVVTICLEELHSNLANVHTGMLNRALGRQVSEACMNAAIDKVYDSVEKYVPGISSELVVDMIRKYPKSLVSNMQSIEQTYTCLANNLKKCTMLGEGVDACTDGIIAISTKTWGGLETDIKGWLTAKINAKMMHQIKREARYADRLIKEGVNASEAFDSVIEKVIKETKSSKNWLKERFNK